MASPSVWARIDVGFLDKDWLIDLSPAAQLAWVRIILHAKATAASQKRPGLCPALGLKVASRNWGIPSASISEAIEAAILAEELKTPEEGVWLISDSSHFVSERTLRGDPPPRPEPESDQNEDQDSADFAAKSGESGESANGESLSRDRTGQDRTGEIKKRDKPSSTPKKINPAFELIRKTMERANDLRGVQASVPDQDVVRELSLKGPSLNSLLGSLREMGPGAIGPLTESAKEIEGSEACPTIQDCALALFSHALESWGEGTAVTWQAVYRQRIDLLRTLRNSKKKAPTMNEKAMELAKGISG